LTGRAGVRTLPAMTATPSIRLYLLLSLDPNGGVLGVHADASDPRSAADLWSRVNDELRLCHELFDDETLPDPSAAGPGMLCITFEITTKNIGRGSLVAPGSPAPAWRRPTLDEMIAVIEGRTPANIRAWLDGVKP
jgi:hypothetical protein